MEFAIDSLSHRLLVARRGKGRKSSSGFGGGIEAHCLPICIRILPELISNSLPPEKQITLLNIVDRFGECGLFCLPPATRLFDYLKVHSLAFQRHRRCRWRASGDSRCWRRRYSWARRLRLLSEFLALLFATIEKCHQEKRLIGRCRFCFHRLLLLRFWLGC